MNRRTLLLAAPAALAACPGAAPAQPHATPISIAYASWLAYLEWLNSPSALGLAEVEYNAAIEHLGDMESAVLAPEPTSRRDVLMQVLACSHDGEALSDYCYPHVAAAMRSRLKRLIQV